MDPTTGSVLRQLWMATTALNEWWDRNGAPYPPDFRYSEEQREELKILMAQFSKAAVKWRLLEPPD